MIRFERLSKIGAITGRAGKSGQLLAQRGQGMTEYIIIVALIAVAAIAVYQIFGTVVRSQTAAIANEVGGVDGSASQKVASDAATLANQQAVKKGLNNYTGAAKQNAGGG